MVTDIKMSSEELQKKVEEAQKAWQAALDKMTPEERAEAERKAQKLVEDDRAAMDAMIEEAKKAAVK